MNSLGRKHEQPPREGSALVRAVAVFFEKRTNGSRNTLAMRSAAGSNIRKRLVDSKAGTHEMRARGGEVARLNPMLDRRKYSEPKRSPRRSFAGCTGMTSGTCHEAVCRVLV